MSVMDTGNGNNMIMPVAPMYGGGGYGGGMNGYDGFGGSGWWVILFLFALMGNGFGGWGNNADGAMLFPWMNQNNQVNDGFRDQMMNTNITSIRDGISGISTQLCNGFAGTNSSIANGFAQSEISANARQMADMNQRFALQSQLADCCCANRLATCQTQNIIQNEGNQTRFADANNTRDIIDNQNRNSQAIMDKLCALELDGVKNQLEQAQRENVGLQNQLNMATLRESQTAQNAFISQGFANEVDQLYNRLNNCPIPSTPVFGRTPVFACNQNQYGCGCGCGCGA
jgi:hypothetical protein